MRRTISFLTALALLLALPGAALAVPSGSEARYGCIRAEFSDALGTVELLPVMCQDGRVYAEAEALGARLGCQVSERTGEYVALYSGTTGGLTVFYYDSTRVARLLFNRMVDSYEAPYAPVRDAEGIWLPMEYALLLLGSSALAVDGVLEVAMPEKNIVDLFSALLSAQDYPFDWNRDLGYTEADIGLLGGAGHMVNVFNGVLTFDGASWLLLFQQFAQDYSAYDIKYGEDLALLLCTSASGELKAAVEQAERCKDLLSPEGRLGELLDTVTASDKDVGELNALCQKYLEQIRGGNSNAVYMYNRSYQQLERAIGSDVWYSELAQSAKTVQSGLSGVTSLLDVGLKVAEVTGYMSEFANQDRYALEALSLYLDGLDDKALLPEAAAEAMGGIMDRLGMDMASYSVSRFIQENLDTILEEGAAQVIGSQANLALLAWSLASNYVPFVSDGLQAADKFELATYATVFQADAQRQYQAARDDLFRDGGQITAEKLSEVAARCYVYLKSCYIARDAAIASLDRYSGAKREQLQPLIDAQNAINEEIAACLAQLRTADAGNAGLVFGFLPADSAAYLADYDRDGQDGYLADLVLDMDAANALELVTEVYSQSCTYTIDVYDPQTGQSRRTGQTVRYSIPKIKLPGPAAQQCNTEIYDSLYPIIQTAASEVEAYGCPFTSAGISYQWAVNGDVLSLVVCNSSAPDAGGGDTYMVYNLSVSTGALLSDAELAAVAGLSTDAYCETAAQVLGARFWSGWDRSNENFSSDSFAAQFNAALERTISRENIDEACPYLNDQGQMCIVAKIYSLAGADYNWHALNMEDFTPVPDYAQGVAPAPASDLGSVEEIEALVAAYYNANGGGDGKYVVFSPETVETADGTAYSITVRFQAANGTPTTSANVLVATVRVDKATGAMYIDDSFVADLGR